MTDDEKIALIALMLGDVPGGPYYPMFTPEQYTQFLTYARGDINRALISACISASFMVSSESSREVIGELSISSSTASNYLKLLDHLINQTSKMPPPNLMPWFAGMGECDKNKLLNFNRCDPEWLSRLVFHQYPLPSPGPIGGCC